MAAGIFIRQPHDLKGEVRLCESFLHVCRLNPNLVIRPGLAVSGTIVLTTKKAREEAEGGAAPEAANFPEES